MSSGTLADSATSSMHSQYHHHLLTLFRIFQVKNLFQENTVQIYNMLMNQKTLLQVGNWFHQKTTLISHSSLVQIFRLNLVVLICETNCFRGSVIGLNILLKNSSSSDPSNFWKFLEYGFDKIFDFLFLNRIRNLFIHGIHIIQWIYLTKLLPYVSSLSLNSMTITRKPNQSAQYSYSWYMCRRLQSYCLNNTFTLQLSRTNCLGILLYA